MMKMKESVEKGEILNKVETSMVIELHQNKGALHELIESSNRSNQEMKEGEVFFDNGICYKVLSKQNLFVEVSDNQNLTGAITIPNTVMRRGQKFSVISIGEGAFSRSSITLIELPTTSYIINDYAFLQTTQLKKVIFNEVYAIGLAAFRNSGVEHMEMPTCPYILESQVFFGTKLKRLDLRNATKIGNELLGYSQVEEILLPEIPYDISYRMFTEAFALKFVDLSYAKTVGRQAFLTTYGITVLICGEIVPKIQNYAFFTAANLTLIYPDTELFKNFSKEIDQGWGVCTNKITFHDAHYRDYVVFEGACVKLGYTFSPMLEEEQLQFKWYKNGVCIEGATKSMLRFNFIAREHMGEYELEIKLLKSKLTHRMGKKYIKVKEN